VDVLGPNGFKVLKVPALGENNVNFETITDLFERERKVSKVLTIPR
jgi:hypothetical protein